MKLYLYLGRRDKKGIKVLSVFRGQNAPASRVQNIEDLNLPSLLEREIKRTIYENRMMWEVWIEGAEDFGKLKKSLKNRGYSSLPVHSSPLHQPKIEKIATETPSPIKTSVKKFTAIKTMIKKRRD